MHSSEARGKIRKKYGKIVAQAKNLAALADGDGDDAASKLLSILMNDLGQRDQGEGDQQ